MRVEIVKINCDNPEASLIRYAADQIRAGEVLGMPTDTFYGLAADPFNLRAVDRVYDIKSRSRHKPLSLLIADVDQAEQLAQPLPEEFYALARRFWPGPLTIIVKASSRLPLKVTANTGNVALRVPKAPIPLAVVQAAQIPITATSANLSGESECTTALAVRDQLQDRICDHRRWRHVAARSGFDHHRSHRRRSPLAHHARRRDPGPGDFRVFRARMNRSSEPAAAQPLALVGGGAGCDGLLAAFLGISSVQIVQDAGTAGSSSRGRDRRLRSG